MKNVLVHKLEQEKRKVKKFRIEGYPEAARQAKRNVIAIQKQIRLLEG